MKILQRIGIILLVFALVNYFCSHLNIPIFDNKLIWIVPGLIGGILMLIVKVASIGKEEEEDEIEPES